LRWLGSVNSSAVEEKRTTSACCARFATAAYADDSSTCSITSMHTTRS
jgi:hypothetical protein